MAQGDIIIDAPVIFVPWSPCMFCGIGTAWVRPSPTHKENSVCFDCIPKMTQLWDFAGLTEPKGD